MIFTLEERPSDSLYVEKIWRTQNGRTGLFISQAATRGEIVVIKHNGKTSLTVRGPETRATFMDYQWTDAEFFGIRFKLGAFMPLLPPGHLRDRRDANLPEVSSKSFWLHGSAWQFPDYENADTFVDRLVHDGLLVREPVVEAVLRGHSHEWPPRAVQYRFLRATGLTQKAIQQIERARYAATLLEHGMSILDTAYEAGYFDQSHLTNSLKRFLGQTPAQIAHVTATE
jgi:hypothetical protein